MERHKSSARAKIKAFVTSMKITKAKKNAMFGTEVEFMFIERLKLREASTTKNFEEGKLRSTGM